MSETETVPDNTCFLCGWRLCTFWCCSSSGKRRKKGLEFEFDDDENDGGLDGHVEMPQKQQMKFPLPSNSADCGKSGRVSIKTFEPDDIDEVLRLNSP